MITSFTGDYDFLSNYYDPCPIRFGGRTYRNSEAAYQAQKCADESKKDLFTNLDPDEAKGFGRKIKLVDDWDNKRLVIMDSVLQAKFDQHPDLAARLLMTGGEKLVEGNTWHDNFFGDCQCVKCRYTKGKNWLGRLLMYRRRKLWEAQNGD